MLQWNLFWKQLASIERKTTGQHVNSVFAVDDDDDGDDDDADAVYTFIPVAAVFLLKGLG